jgi:hypothetical protein
MINLKPAERLLEVIYRLEEKIKLRGPYLRTVVRRITAAWCKMKDAPIVRALSKTLSKKGVGTYFFWSTFDRFWGRA